VTGLLLVCSRERIVEFAFREETTRPGPADPETVPEVMPEEAVRRESEGCPFIGDVLVPLCFPPE
jgi:hypothetical protein